MLTDTECVKLVCDILKELDMNNFTVKVRIVQYSFAHYVCKILQIRFLFCFLRSSTSVSLGSCVILL